MLDGEEGFSLPELLVTMLLMMTAMIALYSVFDMSLRVFSFGNDKTEAVENARLGMERMEREIRTAYPYNKLDGDTTNDNILYGVPSSTTVPTNPAGTITFFNDLNGDYAESPPLPTDPGERITYALSTGPSPTLLRNGEPVVEFVRPNGLRFTFCESVDSCDPVSPPLLREGQVKLVHIELRVEVDRGISGAATQTLITDVKLRNRIR